MIDPFKLGPNKGPPARLADTIRTGPSWVQKQREALFFFKNFIEVQLIYSVVFISAVQQSDSVVHLCILFHILFRCGLLQDMESGPLWGSFIL